MTTADSDKIYQLMRKNKALASALAYANTRADALQEDKEWEAEEGLKYRPDYTVEDCHD